ncbi:hypothetical protein FDT66_13345 [Polaribacter aestuariivivens]|uniref:DUF4369 domain-containing protein n=1 Tax=Polaribacter aestuariivivens TaxID=2304626 RepID=A0A5S3N6V8_9FLAO|nr:hypothetical protein [Polaribacter aestuariivivens]TMM28586.1 hypothetical protein FDT66_13345 [Polaribacter aestuariivivens]
MKKQKLTLLLLTLIISIGNAQNNWVEGSLILKNGDTITGNLKLPLINKGALINSHKIKFKKNENDEEMKYDNTNVNKAIIKERNNEIAIYEYVKTSRSKYQLFKLIEFKKMKLYARIVSNSTMSPNMIGGQRGFTSSTYYSSQDNEFYALRKNEKIASPLITLPTNISASLFTKSFRKRAMKYFSDCPSLVKKLKKRKFRESQILEVIAEYDSCE